jgi:hypothetical protein
MKKASRNLVLRSETLRTLANMDLSHVAGGDDSGAKQCPAPFETGAKQCPAAFGPGAFQRPA